MSLDFAPTIRYFPVNPGSLVAFQDRLHVVRRILGADRLVVADHDTGQTEVVSIHQLGAPHTITQKGVDLAEPSTYDLAGFTDAEVAEAKRRYELIEPLLARDRRTRADVMAVAQLAAVHLSTIYEWLKTYEGSGSRSALIPGKRGVVGGISKLNPAVDEIISEVIDSHYLTEQKLLPGDVIAGVEDRCRLAGLPVPHSNTIRKRIAETNGPKALYRRGYPKEAKALGHMSRGKFPEGRFPLDCVLIDHTPLDIMVVYEDTRQPWCRPWLTLAICAYSRMIVGIYLRSNRPSSLAAGMCLAMGMLPKQDYLDALGLPGRWPVFGKPGMVHCDNAKEFKGKVLQMACDEHDIGLTLRAVKRPEYGAIIERMIGNVNRELHKKPGTTFSNPTHRGSYDSKAKAALSMRELEAEIVDWVVNVYQLRKHSELQMPPIKQWEVGIFGDAKTIARGLPEVFSNPRKLTLDFMPFKKRTVQSYGVELNRTFYYHEVLNRWNKADDPSHPGKHRQFIVRYDPRQKDKVWFWDPEARDYYELAPRISPGEYGSHEEHLAVMARRDAEGDAMVDKEAISAAKDRSQQRIQNARDKTRSAKRDGKRTDRSRDDGKSVIESLTEAKPTVELPESNLFAMFEGEALVAPAVRIDQ